MTEIDGGSFIGWALEKENAEKSILSECGGFIRTFRTRQEAADNSDGEYSPVRVRIEVSILEEEDAR